MTNERQLADEAVKNDMWLYAALELVKTDRRRGIHFRRYLERQGMSLAGISEQGTLEARK